MQTDELIQILARDAAPVRRLASPWRRTAIWLAISLTYVSLLVVLMSPSLAQLAGIRAPRFWLEQAAALTTGIAAAVAALTSVVPGGSRRAWLLPAAPAALWIGTLVWGCVQDWMVRGPAGLVVYSDWPCVAAMILAALVPATAIAFMLRLGAPLTPLATGAVAGLAVAGLSNVTACLSRPAHATTATVLVWHVGTAAGVACIAAWACQYLREWPTDPPSAAGLRAAAGQRST